jgi:hypothetical protein
MRPDRPLSPVGGTHSGTNPVLRSVRDGRTMSPPVVRTTLEQWRDHDVPFRGVWELALDEGLRAATYTREKYE